MSDKRDPLSTALLLGLVRASPVIVLGCIYLWMRESLSSKLGGLDWFAPPMFLITASFIIGVTVIRRRTLLPAARRHGADEAEEGPGFDADAAFERYLANKGAAQPTPVVDKPVRPPPLRDAPPPAPRGGFGRKTSQR